MITAAMVERQLPESNRAKKEKKTQQKLTQEEIDAAEAAWRERDYMNYMDGVAENLPRVMYVHGSGQEIINFDRME